MNTAPSFGPPAAGSSLPPTIPVNFPLELLLPYLEAGIAEATAAYRATLPDVPPADPLLSVPQVAGLLRLTPETVRGYLHLYLADPRHPRALPFVATSDYARGNRVPQSELLAWHRRNMPGAAPLVAPTRQAKRKLTR